LSNPAKTGWVAGLELLGVGALGALLGEACGMPAGTMIGALLTSGLYRLAGGAESWRKFYGRVGRLLLGTVVGAAFGPDVIQPLKATLLPMAVLIVAIVAVGVGLGWLLGRFTQLDPATALISALPGGLPAMAATAEEVEADATVVSAIHFSRLTTILLVTPALIRLLTGTWSQGATTVAASEPAALLPTAAALALGLLGGLLALRTHIPTADLVGPILAVGGVNLLGGQLGPLPDGFRQAAMLLIGVSVGAQMSRESLRRLRTVALPAAAMIATLIASGLLLGWGLSLVTPLDPVTALLSGLPGGASTMPVIAHDLGGDIRLVAALHLTRQLVMLIVIPAILSHLLRGRRQKRTVVARKQTCSE